MKFDGILDLLSLCNVMELGNVLSKATYQVGGMPSYQRHQLIQARLLCRKLVGWLGSTFEFISNDGQTADFKSDIHMFYLARQAKALVAYISTVATAGSSKQGCSSEAVQQAVDRCFSGNVDFQEQWSSIKHWVPDTLAWPSGHTKKVLLRNVPLPFVGKYFIFPCEVATEQALISLKMQLQGKPAMMFVTWSSYSGR